MDDLIDKEFRQATAAYRKIMGKRITVERVKQSILDFPHLGVLERPNPKAKPKVV